MHQSSLENMQRCYERHVKVRSWSDRDVIDVVDIGGANVNGSYADIFSGPEFRYRAVDIAPGEAVDIVLDDPYQLPFADESIDVLISGQAFEHVEFFWLLFSEMVRVLKPDGLILLIAPSAGPIHRYPVDCYRFYPDAYRALATYCDCKVLEIVHDDRGPWKDLVGVFAKADAKVEPENRRTWKPNRYELETRPATTGVRHPDPDVERLQGAVPYLEVLERLHASAEPEVYLEIGVRHGTSLRLARKIAMGIDPQPDITVELLPTQRCLEMTSDEFFAGRADEELAGRPVDLAFIDGMHLFEFALRDFIHVERHAGPGTIVVIDDVLPNHPVQARRQRESEAWTGDVWKLADCLASHRKDLKLTLLDTHPTGLLVVTGLNPKNRVLAERYNPIVRHYKTLDMSVEKGESLRARSGAVHPFDASVWATLIPQKIARPTG